MSYAWFIEAFFVTQCFSNDPLDFEEAELDAFGSHACEWSIAKFRLLAYFTKQMLQTMSLVRTKQVFRKAHIIVSDPSYSQSIDIDFEVLFSAEWRPA